MSARLDWGMKIRALIVDDERLARSRLAQLLAKEQDIEVIGECASGREAVGAIRERAPDLVFLDIQMPELDGFGVIQAVGADAMPAVVFVTAFDKYAVKAFEVHAVDYLLKPFDRTRFQAALAKARSRLERRGREDWGRRLAALAEEVRALKEGRPQTGRLAIKSEGRVIFLKVEDIDWVEAADNYVNIHAGKDSFMHRETMTSLEGRLPADRFLRISRSTIVNADRVKELQPLFHGDHAVILRDGTRLTLSRNHRDKLNRLLGK